MAVTFGSETSMSTCLLRVTDLCGRSASGVYPALLACIIVKFHIDRRYFIQGLLIMEDDLDEGHEEDESDVTPTSSTSNDLACLLSIRKLSIFQFLVDKNLLPK